MPREYCPACGAVRNLSVTTAERTVTDEDDKEQNVLTRTYHCESCGRFVRSEDAATGGR